MDRRGVVGTLLGAAALPLSDQPASTAMMAPTTAGSLLKAFRAAFNGGDSRAFCDRWASPTCRVSSWGETAGLDRGGPGAIDALLARVRAEIGGIAAPVAAGQYLMGDADDTIRYFATFGSGSRRAHLEVTLLLQGSATGRLREIRIGDPARFAATTVAVVDMPSDGRRDISNAVQAVYDELVHRGGGTLQFPPGRFRLGLTLGSRNVQLRGAGRLATQLIAVEPAAVILRGAYRSGSWDVVTISDLTLTGGEAVGGIGFRAGGATSTTDDEFAGRTRFDNVRFVNLDICIDRPAGQVGLSIDNCQFEDARIHISGTARGAPGRALMHGGNMLVRNSHFQRASEAVVRLDSAVTGSGQVAFADCIMEANPGIVFDVRNLNASDSVPAMTVARCWNEQNATAPSVTIDGRAEPPVYARLTNCSLVRFEDTPLGSLTLHNSVVRTIDCSLDQLKTIRQDPASLIEHARARAFSAAMPPGRTDSVEATYLNEPGRGSTFWLSPRQALSKAYSDKVVMSSRGDRPLELVGTETAVTRPIGDAALPGAVTAQWLDLGPGMEVFPPPATLVAGHWIAWLYLYRHAGGTIPTLTLTGSTGLTLETPLDSRDWQTIGGMTRVPAGATSVSFWHRCNVGPASLVIGGINLLSFETRQQARDFLNSGLFAV